MTNKSSNKNLTEAKQVKNDEFYTQLSDIERELGHHKEQFKGKIIFCNCDDPESSNFWKYFTLNFEFLGLRKLIATHFDTEQPSYKLEIERDATGKPNKTKSPLKQNGDFRSSECIEILDESDIVVTNPPFSLFREFVNQLVKHGVQFLIIGNDNAITYKDVFKLIQENRIWSGYCKVKEFHKPDGSVQKFGNIGWFTNLDVQKRHEDLILYKKYATEDYATYDNYDAININKTTDIPCDYSGAMGVPISFFDKHNPRQFDIIGCSYSYGEPKGYHIDGRDFSVSVNGQ
jgi:hypothetical protein